MKIVVTAGPTREPLDPVRFLSNRSSGKMGYAMAAAARGAGHEVILISGPVALPPPDGVRLARVTTADDMKHAVESRFDACDVLIMAAAVADWRAPSVPAQKIKKGAPEWIVRLVPTPDILAGVSARKTHQIVVGFAAESERVLEEARRKRDAKRCDLLVANDISRADSGFDVDTNEVTLLFADGHEEALPLLSKRALADRLIRIIEALHAAR